MLTKLTGGLLLNVSPWKLGQLLLAIITPFKGVELLKHNLSTLIKVLVYSVRCGLTFSHK